MWPWEHLAVAYVLYSLVANAGLRVSPSTRETIAVLLGSQLPDLVDKPLAWTVGVTETGYSVGHSLFVAPFVCLAAYAVTARLDDRLLAGAFSLAYGSHLATDALNPMRMGRRIEPRVFLWPVTSPPANDHGGLLDHFVVYFVRYASQSGADGAALQLAFPVGLSVAVLALWLADGAPVADDVCRFLRARLR